MPEVNGPTNGPPIIHDPPGYLDGPLAERARLRAELDRLKAAQAAVQQRYNRLEEFVAWTMLKAGIRRIYNPFTGTSTRVNTSGSGINERPTTLTDEECGLSTQIILDDDQRRRLAEILGGGGTTTAEPAGDRALTTLERAIRDVPPTRGETIPDDEDSPHPASLFVGPMDPPAWLSDAEKQRRLVDRPRPVVSPAFGGPKAADEQATDHWRDGSGG